MSGWPVGLHRSYCLIDEEALKENMCSIRGMVGKGCLIGAVVKSDAYGHGLEICSQAFMSSGADWLCVDSLHEAQDLRAFYDGVILVLGHVPARDAEFAVKAGCKLLVYSGEQVRALEEYAVKYNVKIGVFIKLETGTHRQGLHLEDALKLGREIKSCKGVYLEGLCSHFANIEDTTDHHYADMQIKIFEEGYQAFKQEGFSEIKGSIANSAATILWPHTHFELVRPGIISYGLWPSTESYVTAKLCGRHLSLKPALSWVSMIAQINTVESGEFVGYGCSYETTHLSRIAVIPVGYFDGFDRALSNVGYVLVHGKRAPIRGRICMNMCMVDVSFIPEAKEGDEVVLIGKQGDHVLSVEQVASWAGSINYEFCARIQSGIPRLRRNYVS